MYSSSVIRISPFNVWFRKRYRFTKESVGVTGSVFIVWLISYYLMSVFSNIASNKSPDNTVYARLPDVGFDLLPSLHQLWLTDLFDALLVLPTIVLVLIHRKPAYVANKWFLTSTLCNFERIASVAVTSFPDPRPGCEKVTDQFLTRISAHKCGDCMFSGHTVLFVICACVWTTHPPTVHRVARMVTILFAWSIMFAGSAVVIMNRAHYTVDVLVAWYVGIGNWYLVQYMWKVHCAQKGRLKSINWPAEESAYHENFHSYSSSSPRSSSSNNDEDEEGRWSSCTMQSEEYMQHIRLGSYESVIQLRAAVRSSSELTAANEKSIL